MVNKRLLASVGLLALTAAGGGAARAADAAVPASPAWSWSGFYLGAHAGYAWARDPMSRPVFAFPSGPNNLTDVNARGWLAGFQAGANWQKGAWLGGLEVDVSGSGTRGLTSVSNSEGAPAFFFAEVSQTDKFDMIGSGRVRLGYLPWPNVLLYGTGGLAWAHMDETFTSTSLTTLPGLSETQTQTSVTPAWRFGWAAGIGAETRLGNSNWLARLEYLHYDFGDSGSSSFVETINGVTQSTAQTSGPMTIDLVRAGLSYKFGAAPAAAVSPIDPAPIFTKAPRHAAAPWSWSGFYIGAHGGYGWARNRFDELDGVGGSLVTMSGIDSRGWLGGIQAGANWQKGSLVGGLEIDLSATSIDGAQSISASSSAFQSGALTEGDKFPLLGSARARFGYVLWPTTLVYGTAGLAWLHHDATLISTSVLTGPGFSDLSTNTSANPEWRFGWVAGLGVEKRIADTNLVGRIEYLHYDFGDSGSSAETVTTAGVTTIINNSIGGRLSADVLRAGVSYKFGGDGAGATAPVLVTKAPPRATASWSGFYIGAHSGYGWGHDPFVQNEFPLAPPPANIPLSNVESNGWVGGLQAGANWQVDRFVVGAELDLSASGIKGTTSGSAPIGLQTNSAVATDQFDLLGSGRARAGFLPMQNLLLYGTGGLAWTRFVQSRVAIEAVPGSSDTTTATTPAWRWGWTAGLGAETRIAHSNWLGRVEYLHYDFGRGGSNSFSEVLNGVPFSLPSNTTGRLTADVVRAGVSYLLN